MNGLNTGPVRPPLHVFETIGHTCLWVMLIAAVAAVIGYIVWARFPRTRDGQLIKQLWTACAILGGGATLGAILLLA